MGKLSEIRLDLIGEILNQKYKSSQAFTQYQGIARRYGQGGDKLYMREVHFLSTIGEEGEKTISEIAEQLFVTHGAASQTAARLEKKGYILRKKSGSDRRQTLVSLTPLGVKACRQHLQYDRKSHAAMDRSLFFRYTEEQLTLIRDYEALMYAEFTKQNEEKCEE